MPPKKSTQAKQFLGTHRPGRDKARAAERQRRDQLRAEATAKAVAAVPMVAIPPPPRELSQPERRAWTELAATLGGRYQLAHATRFRNLVGAQVRLADKRLPVASYSSLAKLAAKELAVLTAPPKVPRVALAPTVHAPRASDPPSEANGDDDAERERRRKLRDDPEYQDFLPLPTFNAANFYELDECPHRGHRPDEIWQCDRFVLRLTPRPDLDWFTPSD